MGNSTCAMHRPVVVVASLVTVWPVWAEPAQGAGSPKSQRAGAFRVRGYHQHVFPDRQPMRVMHQRLHVLKEHGYNLVVFGMGSPGKSSITMHADGTITPNGCSTEAMAKLVRHAIDLGLEPVFEMKFIGKQLKLLQGVIDRYPDLVIDPKKPSTVLNAAFRMPDGRDAYSATSLAMVDYLLELYPKDRPARYFFFGIDEFSADDMAKLAATLGMTPPQAFAYCVNLGTDHVLGKGITPLVWGDTMLSPALGTKQHGLALAGYEPDPRLTLQAGGAYHAAFGKSRDHALHTMVDFLRDRDKIIVVDWHYGPSPTGEFPSVDYFQKIGFKDVWGAPWHNETNIRQFARYAARRGCGGMMATAWFDAFTPQRQLTLHFIIGTSAALFATPGIDPPPAGPVAFSLRGVSPDSVDDEKRTGCILQSDRSCEFRAKVTEPITAQDGRLLISALKPGGAPITTLLDFDAGTHELLGKITLPETTENVPYQVRFCYTDAATGVVYVKEDAQGFLVTDRPPVLPQVEDATVLLDGDFSQLDAQAIKGTLWLAGPCAGPIGWVRRRREQQQSAPRRGGLDAQWFDRVWLLPSGYLDDVLSRGMRIHLEAKMTGDFTGNNYCALFTKGSFHTGFRVLVGRDRHLLFQFARLDAEAGGPLWVMTPPHAVPLGRWTSIDLAYKPPAGERPGRASIIIDGKTMAEKRVSQAMPVSSAVIGIGCEFGQPTIGPVGKRRPNFPGLIRKVTLRELEPPTAPAGERGSMREQRRETR